MKVSVAALGIAIVVWAAAAWAGEADVVGVTASNAGGGNRHFDVTVRHADEGWEHYADKWDVVAPDGTVLGTRVLYHPHVDEQPFTRSHRVAVPDGIDRVTVRAHDKVHGYGGQEMTVELER
jgi:hypothetical protein